MLNNIIDQGVNYLINKKNELDFYSLL